MSASLKSTSLIAEAKKIVKGNYTYSNDILYGTCGGVSVLPKPGCVNTCDLDKFASAMLMIGRVYSASPQRSAKANSKTKANGTADFFNDVASRIVNDSAYTELYTILMDMISKKYSYDKSDADFDLLQKSLECVSRFNEILKNSICRALNLINAGDVKNNISFCSKFLHFVLPDVFFIIDSISEKGGKTCIELDKSKPVSADRLENIDDKDTYAYYASHILRAYEVACVLTEAGITPTEQVKVCISFTNGNPVCSMPRLVDSVLMK